MNTTNSSPSHHRLYLQLAIATTLLISSSCAFSSVSLSTSSLSTSLSTSLLSSTSSSTKSFHPFRSHLTKRFAAEENNENTDTNNYDLIVVGAGVVGVQAALAAASAPYFKKNVLLVDAPRASGMLMNEATGEDLSLGGPTGLFSKALRDTSKRIKVSTLRGMGLREDSVWNEIINSCVDLASSNAEDIERQLEMAGVAYKQGFASFPDSGETHSILIQKDDGSVEICKTDKVLIATGSKPFRPGGIPFDGQRIFDSDSINTLSYLPKSIVITGSGIIAVEFAKIFSNLGAEVTMIIRDVSPRNALQKIGLDKDVAATLVADIVRSGIKIERGAQVASFDVPTINTRAPIKITLEAKSGEALPRGHTTELKCDAYLAAVGRNPNTQNLNLAAACIEIDEYGGILVDSRLCATAKAQNVFAAGDVLGRPFLASTGVAQGKAAVISMFGPEVNPASLCAEGDAACVVDGISQAGTSFDPASLAANPFAFPTGVWSSPEAAYYGLSTQQAAEMGIEAGEAISLYAECLRGRVFSPNGLLKLVYEKPAGRILGVHICGDDACELIHYGMELVKGRRTVVDLTNNLFSAVTYHEMYKIAAQAALDEPGARKRRAAAGAALAKRNRISRTKENAA
jgi:NAD(P) transhydrogenase